MMSERDQLAFLVEQWNENRLDLFHLTQPTEELEIEGVMRFYFQDGGERVLTKCVRVSSTATTRAVVDALSDKFLPDLKMLTDEQYSLWEVHENGSERRLEEEEKPLLVQLNWHRDDKEGRFLLRRDRHATIPLSTIQLQEDNAKRSQRYGKKEKKEAKKKHQKDIVTVNGGREEPLVATDIYRQVPQNTFTRTISNPEVVMKKKREQKWEARLKEMGHGGSLKIYGGELVPSRPYVSILVSVLDRADKILAEAAEKYGVDNTYGDFVLVELPVNGHRRSLGDVTSSAEMREGGRIVGPDECPLQQIAMSASANGPDTYLAIRRRPSDYRIPSSLTRDEVIPHLSSNNHLMMSAGGEPAFLVLQSDGTPSEPSQWLRIENGVTEVGSDPSLAQFAQNIHIDAAEVCGRHCVITYMDGVVTVTPSASEARIEVDGRRISQTEILQDGAVVVFGRTTLFKFAADRNNPFVSAQRGSQPQESDYSHIGQLNMPSASLSTGGSSPSSRQSSDQMKSVTSSQGSAHFSLPISLQIGDYKVWDYLVEVMSRGWADSGSFRLSPAYSLYLALRFFHSHSKPYLVQFFTRIGHHMHQIAQECTSRDELLFWLANASELAFIVERNSDLRTPRSAQLGSVVESLFRRLCTVLLGALRPACQPMLDARLTPEEATAELISLLDSTLRAARASRLNPALTIQLSSQMFHTINATLFNNMVGVGSSPVHLTTRLGRSLAHNLAQIHQWAEHMGVELAAECHLDRTRQAAQLLGAQKNDVAALGATCYKLNSLQVRYLLSHFMVGNGEIPCDGDVLTRITGLAERQADQLTHQDGLPLTLEESDHLSLPFLLPQDGYTAEHVRNVPDGLSKYLYALQEKGLCHSVSLTEDQSQSSGGHMQPNSSPLMSSRDQPTSSSANMPPPRQHQVARSASQTTLTSMATTQFGDSFGSTGDDVIRVTLKRGGGGIGLSIVAAQGIGDRQTGIYVKKVVDGTVAALDGRLGSGDQLLSVNGQSLLGITQEDAAQYMSRSGAEVHLEVRKGAANRNGLATWLKGNTPTGQAPPPMATVSASQSQAAYSASSPAMSQSMNSQQLQQMAARSSQPPSYSHYAPLPKYGSQQQLPGGQTPNYTQRHQQVGGSTRSSAFHQPPPQATVEPNRHVRSISASDLYQNDPNASFSQRSVASTTTGFDRLPSHYRQSGRPTVVQPGRPLASPSSIRRGAASPVSLYRPPSTTTDGGVYRPPSVTNLFAPPKSPTPLQQQGYSSNALRESTQDLFRASHPSSPPHAHSSPLNDVSPSNNYSASLPQSSHYSASLPSAHRSNYNNNYSAQGVPRATVGPNNGFSQRYQEPVVVRPQELGFETREYANRGEQRSAREERTVHVNVHGAVPTAITQALALQAASAAGAPSKVARPRNSAPTMTGDRDVRDLERSSTVFMTRESIDDELDRLDAKGVDMTEAEKTRYRDLLDLNVRAGPSARVSSEQSPARPITSQRRTETLIDDVEPHSSARISARENTTPPDSRRMEKKSVQFMDDNQDQKEDLDSPGIVGGNEVYRDPRQRRLNELRERQVVAGPDGSNLDFRDKMRLFAHQIGENSTPKQRFNASSAERHIQQE